jgi:FKBP-type peptidyl-prolyl cis-trans isomerase SlyD
MQARANDRETSLFAGIDLSGPANAPQDPISNEDLEASSRQETLSPVLSLVDRILIEGLKAGESKSVVVPAALGYGEYSDKLIQRVPLDRFGANKVEIGMRFHAETNLGMRVLVIRHVDDKEAVLDGNHELAGKTLYFDVKVVAVRAAELTELAHGHPHQAGGCCGGGGAKSGDCGCSDTESSEGGCCSSEEKTEKSSGGCGNGGCGCSQ